MLKKLVILILVIGLLGALAVVILPRDKDSDKSLASTDQGTDTEDSTETTTQGSTTGSTEEPTTNPVFDVDADSVIVYDYRTNGFNTEQKDSVLYIPFELDPNETYEVNWLCSSALPPVLTSYGATYRLAYTLDEPSSDVATWIDFDHQNVFGTVCSDTFTTGETGKVCLYLFESDADTDLDSIYVSGKLLDNFKFVILH